MFGICSDTYICIFSSAMFSSPESLLFTKRFLYFCQSLHVSIVLSFIKSHLMSHFVCLTVNLLDITTRISSIRRFEFHSRFLIFHTDVNSFSIVFDSVINFLIISCFKSRFRFRIISIKINKK